MNIQTRSQRLVSLFASLAFWLLCMASPSSDVAAQNERDLTTPTDWRHLYGVSEATVRSWSA